MKMRVHYRVCPGREFLGCHMLPSIRAHGSLKQPLLVEIGIFYFYQFVHEFVIITVLMIIARRHQHNSQLMLSHTKLPVKKNTTQLHVKAAQTPNSLRTID